MALATQIFDFLSYLAINLISVALGRVCGRTFSASLLLKIDLRKNEDRIQKSESLKPRVWVFSRSGINILGQNKLVPEISKQKTACGTFETIQNVKLHILG